MTLTLSNKQYIALFSIAFFLRALLFLFLIQPNGFYKQADSMDYHNSALSIATGNGMHRIDTKEPIFWRTPGYPPYLAFFYNLCGLKSARFEDNATAQKYSIWLQIILSSFIPIILFFLAYALTQTYAISIILAWLSVFHPGIVLSSTYLLTEGLALIFFYLFLALLYQCLSAEKRNSVLISICGAAIALSAYTWMRPMGEFIGCFTTILIIAGTVGDWKQKVGRGFVFGFLFFTTLAPWYVRNYSLTGEWFFCPTIGTYLNCFSVPKILRRTLNKPIEECLKISQQAAGKATHQKRLQLRNTGLHVSNTVCKDVAYPVIKNHPFYFAYDWISEAIKTTFDLYSYQLIPMVNGSYWYDPIEEYLPEKIAACLWTHQMPWYGRVLCWLEFLFSIFIWMGLFGGLWVFIIRPLVNKAAVISFAQSMMRSWLLVIPMIGIVIGMTGGFGYARLRLPAEPLMLILSFSFWYWLYLRFYKDTNK